VTVGDLTATLRRHWLVAILVFCVVVGIGVAATALSPERYRSKVTVSVVPADKAAFDFGGTQIVQYLVPPVLTRVQSSLFARGIRERLPPDVAGSPVEITVDNEPGTGIIELGVISSTPRAAFAAATVANERLRGFPGSTFIDIATLTPPSEAKSVRSERTPPIIAGSVVLAFILAALAAVAANRLRPAIPRAAEFRRRYGPEVLGEIPRKRKFPRTAAALFGSGGPPEISTAFRNLEARFAKRLADMERATPRAVVAVTSWGAGEGKTTVAANLAWATASLEHLVTIADFDLRRPRVHELLEVPQDLGVADIAAGADVDGCGHPAALSELWVIPAGTVKGHPTEAVHAALGKLDDVAARFVLLDTPPMFTAETVAIIGVVDAVLLVVDGRNRSPREIEEAMSELALAGTPVLGVVLNRVKVKDGRGRMGYYYDYSPNGSPPSRTGLRSRIGAGRRATTGTPKR
jgi:Mrp family chromosome partitioning ATPase